MRLTSFEISNYQSVLSSGAVKVGDITCLVGKNEAGETALLRALYKLNPIRAEDASYSVTDDYPRLDVGDYEDDVKAGKRPAAEVVTATFDLEQEDCNIVAKVFGPEALRSKVITVSKGYGNAVDVALEVDEEKCMEWLCRNLPADIKSAAEKAKTATELVPILQPRASEPAIAAIMPIIQLAGAGSFKSCAWTAILSPHLPKFLYFDEYYQMTGCENIEQLMQRKSTNTLKPSDYPLLGLIDTAGLDLDQLVNAQRTQEIKNKLEGAGNRLTRRILDYWSQNKHLQMRFDVRPARQGDPEHMRSGTNIWGEVYDTRHHVTTGLGTRSRGFVWFFSFIAWYTQIKEQNVILLLDEPGLTLHGRAQADLLGYFEKELKDNHQLIYTTHSPFMIDPKHFERVTIVQDRSVDLDGLSKEEQGTKVISEILQATEDSLFPLQGALGYEIHQTLFVGPNTLLLEGPSDMLYLSAISSVLEREGREGLSRKWTMTPVGGAGKVPTFVRLLTGQRGMTIATLLDVQAKDKTIIEGLYREKLLKKTNVLTFADFTGGTEADIEDMFESDFYLDLVNAEYKSALKSPLTIKALKTQEPRILVRLDKHFTKHPLTKGGFNHYRPARYLHENLAALSSTLSEATKERFEKAFHALNGLLT